MLKSRYVVAVDVGETGALALIDPQRQVVVAPDHPGHRHAVGHDPPASLEQRCGPRVLVAEPCVLGVLELADPHPVNA